MDEPVMRGRERARKLVTFCKCSTCVSCCERNPGWMTPDEAVAAMDAGLAKRLMRDWYESYDSKDGTYHPRFFILAPASKGAESQEAPECPSLVSWYHGWYKGRCNFLTKQGLCELHDSGFKPLQCRTGSGCSPTDGYYSNLDMAKKWDTKKGRAAIKRWEKEVGFVGDD